MFNYIGVVKSRVTENMGKGIDLYYVDIPAISSEPIVASALTKPGEVISYNQGDTVILAEVERNQEDGIGHIILGLFSKKITSKIPVRQLFLDNARIHSGEFLNTIQIVAEKDSESMSNAKVGDRVFVTFIPLGEGSTAQVTYGYIIAIENVDTYVKIYSNRVTVGYEYVLGRTFQYKVLLDDGEIIYTCNNNRRDSRYRIISDYYTINRAIYEPVSTFKGMLDTIKELTTRIETLETELAATKARVEVLENT